MVFAMPVRIALADDSLLIREGLEQMLSREPEIELVVSCADVDELLDEVAGADLDVVVTDIRMPPTMTDEGIQIASRLRETAPEIGVLVLSNYAEPRYALELIEGGSERRGYLLKERIHDRAELRAAILTIAKGGSMMDPVIVDSLVSERLRREASPLAALTPREREVLAEIAQGKNNAAIAESLVLTKRAVEKHINSIFLKLDLALADDVNKRVKAALLYLSEKESSPI
jgi:DNA-binding NarL/FixJ family response regulator